MSSSWYAIRTAPMKEFAVAEMLRRYDLRSFCPTETKWRRTARHKRMPVTYAMLPRYTFMAGADPWDVVRAFQARGVQGVVGFSGRPAIIPDAAIARLARMSGAAIPTNVAPVHRGFTPGDKVRVSAGPLIGRLYELQTIKGRSGVILASMFGAEAMPVEIPLDALEAA